MVPIDGSYQLCRRRFAFMLPDELALGVDEVNRWPLRHSKHACPAALVILGELHEDATLAACGEFALDLAARTVKHAGREDDNHHQGGGVPYPAERSMQSIQWPIRPPIREIH